MIFTDVRHIFFDLDKTLWDFEKNSSEALSEIFERHRLENFNIRKEDFIEVYIKKNEYCWDLYRKNQIQKTELRFTRFLMALNEFGINNQALAEALGDDYIHSAPYKTHLIPGAKEVLEYLSPKYTLHIITNGFEEVQHIKLEKCGIEKYFKTVTTSEKAGCKKPDAGIFKFALACGNAYAYESLMIGDDPVVDVEGARLVGMKAIHFNQEREQTNEICPSTIQSLGELYSLL
ncbi:MAG: YjjG family noncanonical pyrimidine nucleotidase [Flavobacteriales bacterium]|nr:YjjG family noncanonical pyrimidine nucleotidase [Flavobacteriales bacterium]